MPHPDGRGRILTAVELRYPPGYWQRGFRSGRLGTRRALQLAGWPPAERIRVVRMDPDYLIARVGGVRATEQRRVALVGCGAIGGYLAMQLAAAGVSRLRLIDGDSFDADNIQRHALGASAMFRPKVEALKDTLHRRFPHVQVEPRVQEVEAVYRQEPAWLYDNDLVVFATGEATLELQMNEILQRQVRRLHVWVEPLGLAGHVLSTGDPGQAGCFGCLFDRSEGVGLHNLASFAAPGQPSFGTSYGGCSGTFTPFGGIEAERAAIEATRVAVDILIGRDARPKLVSWFESRRDFVAAGHKLSPRAERVPEGGRVEKLDYRDPACQVCR